MVDEEPWMGPFHKVRRAMADEITLRWLEISVQTANRLNNAGFTTIGQVRELLADRHKLREIKGIGSLAESQLVSGLLRWDEETKL